jgi:hypothetical protein
MHSLIVPYKDEKEEGRDVLQHIGHNHVAHPDSTVIIIGACHYPVLLALIVQPLESQHEERNARCRRQRSYR